MLGGSGHFISGGAEAKQGKDQIVQVIGKKFPELEISFYLSLSLSMLRSYCS